MRSKHVKVIGANIRFKFRGKSGKEFSLDLNDRRLAKIVNQCQDLPGQEKVTREDFTAKDFRTWAGTVLAAKALRFEGSRQTQYRDRD